MELITSFLLLGFSLAVLIKGSDFFIQSVEKIGLKFGVSPYILGLTVVAMGTSLPELASSIAAVLRNQPEIVLGNVVGSNVTNILLIVGTVAALSRNVRLDREMMTVDIPLLFTSAIILFFALSDGKLSIAETIILIIGLIVFLWNSFTSGKVDLPKEKVSITIIDYLKLIGGGVAVYFGSEYTITGITALAEALNIGSDIIAVTIVSLGTSLPELVVSITAIRRGNPEMAVGNVLGSNIFNTYAVTGIAALFGPLVVNDTMLNFGVPFMLAVTTVFAIMSISKSLSRWEGIMLLMMYIFFLDQAL